MRTLLKISSLLLGLSIIITFVLALSYLTGIFFGYPIGLDTFAHAYKASFIEQYFPDFFWSHHWAQGMPMFLWYAPFPYFLILLANKLLGSMLLSLTWLPILAVAITFIGVFLVTFEVTGSRLLGIAVAILGLTNSAIWARLYMGEIPRIIASSFWPLGVWATIRILKTKKLSFSKNRANWLLVWIINALAFQAHFIFAAVTFFSVLVLIWFSITTLKKKIRLGAKILLPSLALAAYVLIPFIITQSGSQIHGEDFFGKVEQFPISTNALFSYPFAEYFPEKFGQGEGHWGGGLTPLFLPITVLVLDAVLGKRFLRGKIKTPFLLPLFLIAFGAFAFGAVSFLKPTLVYYNGALPPVDSYYFMAIAIPLFLGPALGEILQKAWARTLTSILLIGAISWIAYLQYPPAGEYAKISTNQQLEELVKESKLHLLLTRKTDTNYRFGTDEAEIAIWFNWIYDIPTTRDYYSQGILNQDWRFLYENAVFFWEDNPEQTAFLIDWFAVRWLRAGAPHFNGDKFRNQPELYEEAARVGKRGGLFKVKNPSPILAATNTPTILLIGKDTGYIFRSLAFANLNSQRVITVFGEENLDRYRVKDLEKYDAIYLYQFKTSNFEKSSKLLAEYVKGGGNLLIEGVNAPFPKQKLTNLPDPWPAGQLEENKMSGNWQLKKDLFDSLIDPTLFPLSKDDWKILSASNIKSWAYPVISLSDQPVVVAGNLGEGKVFFTGFNMPFHITTFKNKEESLLLGSIIDLLVGQKDSLPSSYKVNFVSPQKRKLVLNQPAKGILFKEAYYPNWSARVILQNQKKLRVPIHRAGPNFMYVNLRGLPSPAVGVLFNYRLSWFEKLSFLTTATAFLAIGLAVIFPKKLITISSFILAKFEAFDKISSWWDREEE